LPEIEVVAAIGETVIDAVPVISVFVTEVAVSVTVPAVFAAKYVTDAPLADVAELKVPQGDGEQVHVTPASALSFVTAALIDTGSLTSTDDGAVTATVIGGFDELQPEIIAAKAKAKRAIHCVLRFIGRSLTGGVRSALTARHSP